jgi:toxin ParE1/3/4
MLLEWSVLAVADRDAIFDYIEADSPSAAAMVDDRIRLAVENLAEFPEMGRTGRVRGTRELVIPRTPYIAVYRFDRGALRILRILHGSQRWP